MSIDPQVEAQIEAILVPLRTQQPGISCGEAAQHLPEHLRGPFWERAVGRYLDAELAKLEERTAVPATSSSGLMDQLRALADNVPGRVPTALHVGPYVHDILRQWIGSVSGQGPSVGGLLALPIVPDSDCRPGQWRILDQHGEQMAAGSLWPPHLPVRESSLLPEGMVAVVYTPPDGEPCVIVRSMPAG